MDLRPKLDFRTGQDVALERGALPGEPDGLRVEGRPPGRRVLELLDHRGHVGRRQGDDGSSPLYRGPRAVPRVPGARADDDALVAARSEPLAGRVEVGAGRVADKDDGGGRRVLDLRVEWLSDCLKLSRAR